jgi:hypothetical protein
VLCGGQDELSASVGNFWAIHHCVRTGGSLNALRLEIGGLSRDVLLGVLGAVPTQCICPPRFSHPGVSIVVGYFLHCFGFLILFCSELFLFHSFHEFFDLFSHFGIIFLSNDASPHSFLNTQSFFTNSYRKRKRVGMKEHIRR